MFTVKGVWWLWHDGHTDAGVYGAVGRCKRNGNSKVGGDYYGVSRRRWSVDDGALVSGSNDSGTVEWRNRNADDQRPASTQHNRNSSGIALSDSVRFDGWHDSDCSDGGFDGGHGPIFNSNVGDIKRG